MILIERVDVKENKIIELDKIILNILLRDMSSEKNIIWATKNYEELGKEYKYNNQIMINQITGTNGEVIRPRIRKTKKEQQIRIKEKAEVFTPAWICNKQNNLIDNRWFGRENIFNEEIDDTWKTIRQKIFFPDDKKWQDYILINRMEITCGEAPYLTSRYDAVTGKIISVSNRIGILDRKLRIVNENVNDLDEWMLWVKKAYQHIYGFEWQGDNLLLARESLLYTFIDNFLYKFDEYPSIELQRDIAGIVAWNIWQMDGNKFVIPNSCKNETIIDYTLFGEETITIECKGCKKNNIKNHNGIYCKIKDWDKNEAIKFVNLVGRGIKI